MELRRLYKLIVLTVIAAMLAVAFCGCNPAAQTENPTENTGSTPTGESQPSSGTEATDPTQEDPTVQTDPNVGIWEPDPTQGSEATEPSQGGEDPTQGSEATDPTQPTQGEDPTQPTQGEEDPTQPSQDPSGSTEMTFEQYKALSSAEQQAYCETFPSLADFLAWYKQAEAEYNAGTEPPIVIGPGDNVDIGDYIGGNG